VGATVAPSARIAGINCESAVSPGWSCRLIVSSAGAGVDGAIGPMIVETESSARFSS
jgi:hypothetical protein